MSFIGITYKNMGEEWLTEQEGLNDNCITLWRWCPKKLETCKSLHSFQAVQGKLEVSLTLPTTSPGSLSFLVWSRQLVSASWLAPSVQFRLFSVSAVLIDYIWMRHEGIIESCQFLGHPKAIKLTISEFHDIFCIIEYFSYLKASSSLYLCFDILYFKEFPSRWRGSSSMETDT